MFCIVFRNKDADDILRIQQEKAGDLSFNDIAKLAKFDRLMEGIVSTTYSQVYS